MPYIYVDVELGDFDDEDIEAEYKARGLRDDTNHYEMCQRAYVLYHQGKKDEAYAILWELCLDKVNRVV